MNVRVVCFEGIDRSGKDTVRKLFAQRTGERYTTLARFFFSDMAYDRIFGRDTDGSHAASLAHAIRVMEEELGMVTIFIDTPPEVCASREGCQYTVDELRRHREVFLDVIGNSSQRMILSVKEGDTPDDLVNKCIEWVMSR